MIKVNRKYKLLTFATILLSVTLVACKDGSQSDTLIQEKPTVPNLYFVKKDYLEYHKSGKLMHDREAIYNKAMAYLKTRVKDNHNQKLAIVMDIDETVLSGWHLMKVSDFSQTGQMADAWAMEGKDTVIPSAKQFYDEVIKNKVTLFFITGRTPNMRKSTIKNFNDVGIMTYQHIYFHDKRDGLNPAQYKAKTRKAIEGLGYTIIINIGDQYSDLCGGYAEKSYKLPNPFYWIPGCSEEYLQKNQLTFMT